MRGAAAGLAVFLEFGLEFGDDFRMLAVEVLGFLGVALEVVELAGGVWGGVGNVEVLEFGLAVVVAAGVLVVEIFPRAAANGELEAIGLVEDVLADGLVGGAEEGEEADAVFGGIVGQGEVGEFSKSGHQVGETDGLVGFGVGGDATWPAGDERDAMASFPVVAFESAPRAGAVVLVVLAHLEGCGNFGAVVAGKEDEGVLGKVEAVECFEELADNVVELEDEVAVRAGLGFAFESVGGKGGEVNGLGGVEEEERLARRFLGVLFEEVNAFFEEDEVDFFEIEVGGDLSRTVVAGVGMFGQGRAVEDLGGRDGNAVAVDVGVEPVSGGATGGAVEVVESSVKRAVWDGAGVIDSVNGREAVFANGVSVCVKEGEADVPFADEGGCVSFSLEHGGECEAIFFDEAGAAGAGEDAFHAGSKGHASGEDAVASGRADGGRAVGVGKEETFAGKLVDVGCGNFGLIVVATEISVAEIIGEDEEDVGESLRFGRGFAEKEQKECQQGGNGRGKCPAIDNGKASKNERVHGDKFGDVSAEDCEWVLEKFQFQSDANDSKNLRAEN